MELQLNKLYEGFKLLSKEKVKEIDSAAYIFEHEKTGAKLIFLQNEDNEKCFSITFRTPVENHTGLPHILEHSVLNGSKNFPIKDPFAYINKVSISTFLNAFTFPDKTMYPFTTTNIAEYKKFMNIYLDSVFNPNIYKSNEIFLQEGWRYQIDENNNLKINGVVYSEMKGVFSSPDAIIERSRYKYLFPNSQYHFESGGDPKHIPELTYEEFLDFHKKYYHPSNSYIYIYGNVDINEHLNFINNEYLSKYEKLKIDSSLREQKPFETPVEETIYYQISEDEDKKDKTHIEYNFVIDKATNTKLMLGFDILVSVLMDMPSSPLRKALLDSEIAQDISGDFNSEDVTLQPIATFSLSNTNTESKEKFIEIFRSTLQKLAEKGIEKDLIKAAINRKEFDLKEKIDRMPKPILINLDVLNSWLYDGHPLEHVKYFNILEEIKKESQNNYFENLIEKYLLNNPHSALVILEPNHDLDDEKELEEKLQKLQKTLSKEDIEKIKKDEQKLKAWQDKEDTQEDIDKIKILDISEIDKLPQKIESEEIETNCKKVIFIKDKTKGINYLDMFFDARTIKPEMIGYLEILTSLIKESKSKNYSLDELSNLINIYTGGISFSLVPSITKNNEFVPKLRLTTKYLKENEKKVTEIINELFNKIIFEEKKLKETLKKLASRHKISIIENGHIYALNRVRATYSPNGDYTDKIGGIGFYKFVTELLENFDDKKEEILKNIENIYTIIFNKNNMISSFVSDEKALGIFDSLKIKDEKSKIFEYKIKEQKTSEAISTNSQVNYVAKGYNLSKLGFEFSGANHVLRNFLGYGFMWENIRMRGGAYGAKTLINRENDYIYVTYRDPHIKNTLQIYDEIPPYLEKLNLDKKEIAKSIIGTISDLDVPYEAHQKGFIKALEHIKGITYQDLCREREQILNITNNDLKEFGHKIKKILENASVCVVGNSKQIEKNKEIFDKINNPFK